VRQRADRVPFLPGRRLVAVRVTLNELDDAVLIVDTGAERTVISQHLAARLGLDQTHPLRLQPLAGIGQSAPVPVVRLERLRVGASTVVGVEVSVYDLPAVIRADGLLGLNVLNRFGVTLDFNRGLLILRQPEQAH